MIIFHRKRAGQATEASTSCNQSIRSKSHSSGGSTHSGHSIRSKSHSSGGDTDQNRDHSQADTTTTSLRRLRTRLSSREDSSSDNVDQSVGEAIR